MQKLVGNIAKDCLGQVQEESVSTDAYVCDTPRLDQAVDDLQSEFSEGFIDPTLVNEFITKTKVRRQSKESAYQQTVSRLYFMGSPDSPGSAQVSAVLEIATRPTTHVRRLWHPIQSIRLTSCFSGVTCK